jgi:hypothetical protein
LGPFSGSKARLARRQFGGDGLGQGLLDLLLLAVLAELQRAEAFDDPGRGGGAEIAFQQMLLQLLQRGLGQGFLDEAGDDLVGHLFGGAREPGGQALEPALFRRVCHGWL